jgi:hypothetical protein
MTSNRESLLRARSTRGDERRSAPGDLRQSLIRLAQRLGSPPPDLIFVALAALGFAAITALIAYASGLPFVLPTERVSPALGVSPELPLLIAVLGYLACQVINAKWRQHESRKIQLLRRISTDLFYIMLFVIVIYFHFHLKMWMPLLNPHLHDPAYFQIDEQLHSVIAGFAVVRALLARLLPAPDVWYQVAQLGLFIGSFWLHALGERRWHHHNMTALLLNLMIGPLTYLVAPAVGPFIFGDGPNATATAAQHDMYRMFSELQAQGPSWLSAHGGQYFTAPLAAMPSLHIGAACIVSYYALRARSPFAFPAIFLATWIFFDSVVSRWHYLVDLPAGILLAALVIAITNRVCRGRHATSAVARGYGPAVPALSSGRDPDYPYPAATMTMRGSATADASRPFTPQPQMAEAAAIYRHRVLRGLALERATMRSPEVTPNPTKNRN